MSSTQIIQRLWVFSDLHLDQPTSTLYQSFLKALDEPNHEQDCVVFAGDIFEIFVGNSNYFKEQNADFFQKIIELSQKRVKIFYIQGNHDFCLESAFKNIPVTVVDAEVIIGKVYIAHGDLVDTDDHAYLALRKFFRSKIFQKLIDFAPGALTEKIGKLMARNYDQKVADLNFSPKVREKFRAFAQDKKRQGFDFVILGHCHDLDEVQPFYFNMGYPPVHRQFLFYTAEANSFKRRVFPGI